MNRSERRRKKKAGGDGVIREDCVFLKTLQGCTKSIQEAGGNSPAPRSSPSEVITSSALARADRREEPGFRRWKPSPKALATPQSSSNKDAASPKNEDGGGGGGGGGVKDEDISCEC